MSDAVRAAEGLTSSVDSFATLAWLESVAMGAHPDVDRLERILVEARLAMDAVDAIEVPAPGPRPRPRGVLARLLAPRAEDARAAWDAQEAAHVEWLSAFDEEAQRAEDAVEAWRRSSDAAWLEGVEAERRAVMASIVARGLFDGDIAGTTLGAGAGEWRLRDVLSR